MTRVALSFSLVFVSWTPIPGQVPSPYREPIEIAVGDTVHLEIDLHVSRLCRLEWSTLDPSVATIDPGGVLSGVSPGATTLHVGASGDPEPCRGTAAVHARVVERPREGPAPRLDHTLVRRERRAILDRALAVACGDPVVESRVVYLDPVPVRAGDAAARHPLDWLRRAPEEACVTGLAGRDDQVTEPVWLEISLSTPRFLYGGDVEVAYVISGVLHSGPRGAFRSKAFIRFSRAEDGWKVVGTRLESIT